MGDQFNSYPQATNLHSFRWVLNGGPAFGQRTNVWNGSTLSDAIWFLDNPNPYTDVGFSIPLYGTNSAFGTPFQTNLDGSITYRYDQFGFYFGAIPDGDPSGETNQAGAMAIIADFADSYWSYNTQVGSQSGQYPMLAFDFRRHTTNTAFPRAAGFLPDRRHHQRHHQPAHRPQMKRLLCWLLQLYNHNRRQKMTNALKDIAYAALSEIIKVEPFFLHELQDWTALQANRLQAELLAPGAPNSDSASPAVAAPGPAPEPAQSQSAPATSISPAVGTNVVVH